MANPVPDNFRRWYAIFGTGPVANVRLGSKGDIFWLRNWRRRRQSCPELGLDQSENLLDRRGRRYVKGFIENLTQLVGAID